MNVRKVHNTSWIFKVLLVSFAFTCITFSSSSSFSSQISAHRIDFSFYIFIFFQVLNQNDYSQEFMDWASSDSHIVWAQCVIIFIAKKILYTLFKIKMAGKTKWSEAFFEKRWTCNPSSSPSFYPICYIQHTHIRYVMHLDKLSYRNTRTYSLFFYPTHLPFTITLSSTSLQTKNRVSLKSVFSFLA